MAGPEFLHGDRVSLRTLEEEDVAFVRDTVNDPQVWRALGGQYTPTNLAMERKFFEDASRSDDVVQFVVTARGDGDEVAGDEDVGGQATEPVRVGVVELESIEWDRGRAEVAFFVAPEFQGGGYAKDALATLVEYAFDQLGLHKLTAEAFAFNDASRGLLESLGFVEEGRLREEEWVDGEWVDVVRYGLLVGEQ